MAEANVEQMSLVENVLNIIVSHPGQLMAEIESITGGRRYKSVVLCAEELMGAFPQDANMQVSPEAMQRRNRLYSATQFLNDQLAAMTMLANFFAGPVTIDNEEGRPTVSIEKKKDKSLDVITDTLDLIIDHPSLAMGLVRQGMPNVHYSSITEVAQAICSTLSQPHQQHIDPNMIGHYRNMINGAVLQLRDQLTAINYISQHI